MAPENVVHAQGVPLTDAADLNALRELRVVLPTDMHRKLRSLKILRGRNIGLSVAEALEAYFEDREDLPELMRPAKSADSP